LLCDDAIPNLTLIDCTASPAMTAIATEALSRGVHVVTANKQIVACESDAYKRLLNAARDGRSFIGQEATVGAGLPVAATIADLLNAGDEITKIEAALSGSVGFILAECEEGKGLNETIAKAIELGFAEPDPSDDVHGLDLGRKALILSRLAGFNAGDTVTIEPLVVLGDDGADENLRKKIETAKHNNRRLRYLASVAPCEQPCVALHELDESHPFYRMQGDVQIMITGPGAGADQTAGGILADLGRIASRIQGGSTP